MTPDQSEAVERVKAFAKELRAGVVPAPKLIGPTMRAKFADDLDAVFALLSEQQVESGRLRAELAEKEAALKVVRESLTDQAAARLDPTMPLLTPEVLEAWRREAEASYAMAETREERVQAHGLMLLVAWQDRAREALSPSPAQAEGER